MMKTDDLVNEITEMLYVADIETYDLLYVNAAMKQLFHIDDTKPHKCYEIIQGASKPCEFCTNRYLTTESFYTWEYANYQTNRHYILKDKLIHWQGKLARMEIALDITEQQKQKMALETSLERKQTIIQCIKKLQSCSRLDEAIQYILEQIGQLLQADRTYIFQLNSSGAHEDSYEWCNHQVTSQIQKLQSISPQLIDRWLPYFQNSGAVILPDIKSIQETWPEEYQILHQQNIQSLVAVPLFYNEKIIGFIGVDNPGQDLKNIPLMFHTLGHFIVSAVNMLNTQKQLEYLSFYDAQTGLFNRNRYTEDMKKIRSQGLSSLGVAYIDINGLKNINDTLGHQHGDDIISQAAANLKQIFAPDEIYRIGGDEFLILCRNADQRLFERQVKKARAAFLQSHSCQASVGSKWSSTVKNINKLIADADRIMYEEKKDYYRNRLVSPRNRCLLDDSLGLTDYKTLIHAIIKEQFVVYVQPKISLSEKRVIGLETLIRYRRKSGELLPPGKFLPALEQAGMIQYIDFYMFDKACSTLHKWLQAGYKAVPLSVNFSRFSLLDNNFLRQINQIWSMYQVPKDFLEVEITESAEGTEGVDEQTISNVLNQMKEQGYFLSIDDFGSQYADMALFTTAEIDFLKLDKSLIKDIAHNYKSRLLVESFINICHNLNIRLIAVGIETKEQLKILEDLNCYGGQGYLFAKPFPLQQYEATLRINAREA